MLWERKEHSFWQLETLRAHVSTFISAPRTTNTYLLGHCQQLLKQFEREWERERFWRKLGKCGRAKRCFSLSDWTVWTGERRKHWQAWNHSLSFSNLIQSESSDGQGYFRNFKKFQPYCNSVLRCFLHFN